MAVASLNWLSVEFADYDVLVDGFNLAVGTGEYQAVLVVIGVATVLRLYSVSEWVMS